MKRREFLAALVAAGVLTSCGRHIKGKRIGLALGGGGAKGLAHIPMLEVFDQLGIRPYRMAGTSIGAVIGSLYASGMSGADIRAMLDRLTVSGDESWFDSLRYEEVSRWWEFLDLSIGNGGLISSDAFINYLAQQLKVSKFSQLEIPLKIVATDFWERKQVVLDSGELLPAIKASMAIPGFFDPVPYKGKVLVDGGLVNPVPYDLLLDECDVVVAVDVLGERTPDQQNGPSYFETTFNTIQILEISILNEKLKQQKPHIYIKPDIRDIRVLEFNRVDEIYRQSESSRKRLLKKLKPYRNK
jgi:NTE family protein